jgi:hypothetical protein
VLVPVRVSVPLPAFVNAPALLMMPLMSVFPVPSTVGTIPPGLRSPNLDRSGDRERETIRIVNQDAKIGGSVDGISAQGEHTATGGDGDILTNTARHPKTAGAHISGQVRLVVECAVKNCVVPRGWLAAGTPVPVRTPIGVDIPCPTLVVSQAELGSQKQEREQTKTAREQGLYQATIWHRKSKAVPMP